MCDCIKISVIVPMFNVEQYIQKCAIGLLEQTIDDIEIIFVDDACTDNTLEVLNSVIQQYKHSNKSIKIISNDYNKGLSFTRKNGFSMAKGEFISTVDSDDYVDKNMLETMYLKAKSSQADVVVCDISFEYEKYNTIYKDTIPATYDEIIESLLEKKISSSICNKLIRISFINNILVDMNTDLSYMEDNYFMLRVYALKPKIEKVNFAFYHYIQYNSIALTKNRTQLHFNDLIKYWQLVDDFLFQTNQSEKYKHIVEKQKIKSKAKILTEVNSISLRKQNAQLFSSFELKYLNELKTGEKLILLSTRFNLNFIAQVLHKLIRWKNLKI